MNKKSPLLCLILLAITLAALGCGGDTATSNKSIDTNATAEQLLTRMTEKFKATPAISFISSEVGDRRKRGGEMVKRNATRNVTFRNPDRMYFKTTGDNDLEAYYDGKDVTLVSHKDKVWGKIPAPPTIAETVDKINESYGMPLPVADLLGFDSKGQLRNAENAGSILKTETIDGVEYNVLAFKNADVDWEVWLPVSGDPLPRKFHAKYKTTKGEPESTFEFSDWNLSPAITDDTFVAKVPEDYEGIPVIQRASAVIPKIEEEEEANAAATSNTNTATAPEAKQ